jgi:hypothetical protein
MKGLCVRIGVTLFLAVGALALLRVSMAGGLAAMAALEPAPAPVLDGGAVPVVFSAVHTGLSGYGGQDEGFRLTNVSSAPVVLTDTWQVRDDVGNVIAFPAEGVTIGSGASIWCARNALSFTLAFGFTPALEYGIDASAEVQNMVLDDGFRLADSGGSLALFRLVLADVANGDGGPWPAGSNASGDRRSMERIDPVAAGEDANWRTALSTTVGVDALGDPIAGTPGYTNSVYLGSATGSGASVSINEVAWAGTNASSYDEWIELYNGTGQDIDLDGWLLAADDGIPSIVLGGRIPAHGFYLMERTDDTTVQNVAADLIYAGVLENAGESLLLYQFEVADAVVYGNANPSRQGWNGPAVQPYDNGYAPVAGQVLWRKRDEATGLILADTNSAADWANDTTPGEALYGPVREGDVYGKRAVYPGWDWDLYTGTFQITATGSLTVGVAPDNAYNVLAGLLKSARQSVLISAYTFESVWLADILSERAAAGVQVTVLLEGAPAGGLPEQELFNCAQLTKAGAQVYFIHEDEAALIHQRYLDYHTKYVLVDDRWLGVSSENLGNHGLPVDDKTNGTAGDRGFVLITDQQDAVEYVRALFLQDCDPVHHRDVVAYGQIERYTVSPTYTVVYSTGGGYEYSAPFSATMPAFEADHLEVIHAPETSLRYSDGLIGLVLRAGPGDEVYVEQMYERLHWGPSGSEVGSDPNPRLEAYIQAARNGARVRILLDNGFDERRQNYETAFYLLDLARKEGLDLDARLGNPTGRGIHSKMVLVRLGSQKYVHVGSLNGSEASSKVNRELALQVRSSGAYDYVKSVFDYDWAHGAGPYQARLPVIFCGYVPESDHVLISEVLFKEGGTEERGEWIELYNPTGAAVDIGGWLLGDAVRAEDYERLHAFPAGTQIQAGGILVIARRATAYTAVGYASKPVPDFELSNSSDVPDLRPTHWGTGEFALGNAGDEVLLLGPEMQVVDVLAYGTGSYPGVVSFGDVEGIFNGNSLERWPANRDSDDCRRDFRVRYVPDPGQVVAW